MDQIYREPLTAEKIKARAKGLGADIVGIADGEAMNAHPPDPKSPRRPSDISDYDAGHAIVIARRLFAGPTRLQRWNERHKYHNDEITLTKLEETALELALWLEACGFPALIIPPTHGFIWKIPKIT